MVWSCAFLFGRFFRKDTVKFCGDNQFLPRAEPSAAIHLPATFIEFVAFSDSLLG